MFYFRSQHGLTCRRPPRQACLGSRFWCRVWPFVPPTSRIWPPTRATSPRFLPLGRRGLGHAVSRFPDQARGAGRRHEFGPKAPLVHGAPRRVTMKVRSRWGLLPASPSNAATVAVPLACRSSRCRLRSPSGALTAHRPQWSAASGADGQASRRRQFANPYRLGLTFVVRVRRRCVQLADATKPSEK